MIVYKIASAYVGAGVAMVYAATNILAKKKAPDLRDLVTAMFSTITCFSSLMIAWDTISGYEQLKLEDEQVIMLMLGCFVAIYIATLQFFKLLIKAIE